MDPISAIDTLMNRNAIQHARVIQIKPAVPPLTSPMLVRVRDASQEAMRIEEKPKMVINLKFL